MEEKSLLKEALGSGESPPSGSRGETDVRVQRVMTTANFAVLERLTTRFAERGHALNELAQAWLLAQPRICSVISGATCLDQVLSQVRLQNS